jgi:hypothetical protein
MEIKLSKQAILTPLIGLVVAWTLFMFAFYSELFVQPIYDSQGMYQGEAPVIRLSTYLFLAAIVVFGLLALSGQRMALRAREIAGPENSLARAAHRFGNLAVIIALASGAAYAIGNFLGAFTAFSDREENLLVRLFDVYIPILLATGLVVYILLRAFVFRKQVAKGAKKKVCRNPRELSVLATRCQSLQPQSLSSLDLWFMTSPEPIYRSGFG